MPQRAMFYLSLIIGIYTYCIFLLGLLSLLSFVNIFILTVIFLVLIYLKFLEFSSLRIKLMADNFGNKTQLLFISIVSFAFVNFLGALGPETAFDATWYHLTIPKIFINSSRIFFIEGGLFYYSLMPKFTEMLYLSSLILSDEITAKVIHFSFGILICFLIYKFARIFLDKFYSLIAVAIFYSNLVVAWLSITSFVDLTRAFYEILSFYCFYLFTKKNIFFYFLLSSIFLGFAISTKLLSILSIPLFIILIAVVLNSNWKRKLKLMIFFVFNSLLIASPWFLFSYINSGNPIYPLLTGLDAPDYNFSIFYPTNLLNTVNTFFITSQDPVSPIYIIFLPILVFSKFFIFKFRIFLCYILSSLIILLVTPKDGGGRFIIHYLAIYSISIAIFIKFFKDNFIKKFSFVLIVIIFIVNFTYRLVANIKYIPVIFGFQTKEEFLMSNLNFSFGDFYDEDSKIKKIVGENKVLVSGMHNLFYADFNFVLEEWEGSENSKYILVQEGNLPDKYRQRISLIYENEKTNVKLYKIQ